MERTVLHKNQECAEMGRVKLKILLLMDISFVILNYKSKGLLKNCLKSLIHSDRGDLRYEIIVVDNNSGDGIRQMLQSNFSDVIFIQNERNSGMGGGNNLGLRQARGKYAAILNHDTM